MGALIRILHLDDNPLDAQLVALTLEAEQERFPTTLTYVQTREEYLAALKRKDFDIILSDYRMPGYDGDSALASAHEICPEIPFVMVTGELGEEFAVERLQRGATDYVLKDRIFRLIPAIKRALAEAENAKKRSEAEAVRERLVHELGRRQGELVAIIQAMQGGVVVFDTEGKVVLVNEAEAAILGLENASEVQRDLQQFAETFELFDEHGAIVPISGWPVTRVMRGETISHWELRSKDRGTGREWFFSFSGRPVWDQQGRQVLSVLVTNDITERKRAEQEKLEANRRLQEVIDGAPSIIFAKDREGRFLFINRALEELLGKTREEIAGKTDYDIFPREWADYYRTHDREVMRRGEPLQMEEVADLADGKRHILLANKFPLQGKDGDIIGVCAISHDITERKQAEEALKRSEGRFAATFMGSPYPLSLSRVRDGMVLEVNDALLKLYGASRDEVVGKTTLQLGIWSDLKERERIREIIQREGKIYEAETTLRSRALGERRIVVTVTLLPAEENPLVLSVLTDITDRRRMEAEAERAHQRTAEVLESINDAFYAMDRDLTITYVNRKAEEILHRRREELLGKNVWVAFPEAVGGDSYRNFLHVHRERVSLHYETYTPVLKTWVESNVYPSSGGGISVFFRDVSERKRAEDALRESEEKYRGVFEHMEETIVINELVYNEQGEAIDWRILEVNPAYTRDSGRLRSEVVGRLVSEVYDGQESLGRLLTYFAGAVKNMETVRFEEYFAPLRMHMQISAFPLGGSRFATITTNVTERKRAEDALREGEVRFRSVVENMSEGLMLFNAEEMIYQNPASLQIHGYKVQQDTRIQHKDLPSTWQGWDETGRPLSFDEWPLARVLRLESFQNQILHAVGGDSGREFWASYNGYPILGTDGKLALGFITIRDITEQRQAELNARQAELALCALNEELEERVKQRTAELEQANKELEAFSYSVSHDLKAPLRLITGFSELLVHQEQTTLTEKQKQSVATIQQQVTHMDDLIKALLEFSRLTRKELHLVEVDTRPLVEEVVAEQRHMFGPDAGLHVAMEVGELPKVPADPVLLRMVFTNLLSNAFKFTSKVQEPKITIDAEEKDGFYRFRIQDNGVGFSEEHTEKLFKVFQRLHGSGEFEGTGIGLANVKKIIERHGGQVSGKGNEGKGATFFFTLPCKRVTTEQAEPHMR